MSLPGLPPQLHLMSRTWINDPNGLVHDGQRWHVFFQHNPEGGTWGNMSWGHVSSPDLVTFTEHPVALLWEDDHACFSGSAVIDHGDTAGFGAEAMVAVYTSHHHLDSPRKGTETQSLAFSVDGGITFTKHPGPVLDRNSGDFRDPKVFWHEASRQWVMVAVEAMENAVVIYGSPDLHSWTLLSEFRHAGLVAPTWECPDLFPLDLDGTTRWVLIVSVNPGGIQGGSGTRWFLGDFDGTTFTVAPDDPGLWLDWGSDNYASVSFSGAPDGRRVTIGWLNNWDYAFALADVGFPGMLTAPRELHLVTDDDAVRLVQQPVPELLTSLSPGEWDDATPTAPAVAWIELELREHQEVTIGQHTLTWAGNDLVLARAAMAGVAPPKTVRAPLRPGLDRLHLGLLVDHGSLEVFADHGRTVLASLALDDTGPRPLSWTGDASVLAVHTGHHES